MMHKDEAERRQRRNQFALLILIVLSIAAGRIAVVRSAEGDTAFLSANDRSRWCTVAALVEDGTYEIDRLIEIRSERNRRPWGTIDRVVHRGDDGAMHSYSSKPPLYSTLVAGVYQVFYWVTNMTLTDQPIYATRLLLAIVNLPLLAMFLVCTILSIETLGTGYWQRRYLELTVCFGTLILPFTISLNNHLPAAAATSLVLWIYLTLADKLDSEFDAATYHVRWTVWALAGFSAAMVAANELPALSMFCVWAVLFAWLDRQSIVPFMSGAAVVAIAFFATTWIAHSSLRPPYAHRGVGDQIASVTQADSVTKLAETVKYQLVMAGLISPSAKVEIQASDEPTRLRVATSDNRRFALVPELESVASLESTIKVTPTDPTPWSLCHWDDWYEYPGSYWQDGRRAGVDRGEPSRFKYLFHATLGHHGLFSITPLWVMLPLGLVFGMSYGPRDIRLLMAGIAVTSVVCFVFYMLRPEIDRNYGGVSICFRWMLWFAPLWLFAIAPAVNYSGTWLNGRVFLMVLLALSVFSVAVSLDSPWQSPWIYRFWTFLGWIET